MITFPQGFFETEEREGFVVDSTMKTVWAAELEVLTVIAAICEKYQLPWFAYAGTLLGAVRHKGFIPWDDDMDICMLRQDYDKLVSVLRDELPEEYCVTNIICGGNQEQFWCCVMNSDCVSIDEERLRQYHGCPFIVGVDIFPLDFIPRDASEADMERQLFDLVYQAVQLAKLKEPTKKNRRTLKEAVRALEDLCHVKFDDSKPLVGQLWRLGNRICAGYGYEDGDYVTNYHSHVTSPDFKYDKHWFDDMEYLPFETVLMPVPKNYMEVVRTEFGENWQTPIISHTGHEYPYYNMQLREMRNLIAKMESQDAQTEDVIKKRGEDVIFFA
ncbi:MAG: LicD family protein [Butyrivibrio sp.]|nr:LicD family protein [Muribaculum sp.]MCM1551365.1 LicD family protein [Butyrivibrio sp.]